MRGLPHAWYRERSRSLTSQHPTERKPNTAVCTVTAAVLVVDIIEVPGTRTAKLLVEIKQSE